MKKIIVLSVALMVGMAGQAAALPIASQGSVPDLVMTKGANLPQAPAISFANSQYDKASPRFAELITTSFGPDANIGATNSFTGGWSWWGWGEDGYDRDGDDHHYRRDPGGSTPSPNPVPEPATMLLFGAGLIGLAVISRKSIR